MFLSRVGPVEMCFSDAAVFPGGGGRSVSTLLGQISINVAQLCPEPMDPLPSDLAPGTRETTCSRGESNELGWGGGGCCVVLSGKCPPHLGPMELDPQSNSPKF